VDKNTEQQKKQVVPTASAILEDDSIVEMVFLPEHRRTVFAIYNAGRWTLQEGIDLGSDTRLIPFSPNNNLIKNDVVLLPSEPCIYGSEEKLVAEIQHFIHRYVDFDAAFEKVATYYVSLCTRMHPRGRAVAVIGGELCTGKSQKNQDDEVTMAHGAQRWANAVLLLRMMEASDA
jgi:hypothetical protein